MEVTPSLKWVGNPSSRPKTCLNDWIRYKNGFELCTALTLALPGIHLDKFFTLLPQIVINNKDNSSWFYLAIKIKSVW